MLMKLAYETGITSLFLVNKRRKAAIVKANITSKPSGTDLTKFNFSNISQSPSNILGIINITYSVILELCSKSIAKFDINAKIIILIPNY